MLYEGYYTCFGPGIADEFPSATLRLSGVTLQSGGARVRPLTFLDWSGRCGTVFPPLDPTSGAWSTELRPLPFAAREALLRRTVQWMKLKEHTFLTRSGDFSLAVSYMRGTSVSEANELSVTVGIEGGFDWLKLSMELTRSFTRTTTVEQSSTVETTISCAPDVSQAGSQFHCSIWQLLETYDVVDREQAPWADPFYTTGPMPAMVHGTDMTLSQVVGF
jgi:hypothetical protein